MFSIKICRPLYINLFSQYLKTFQKNAICQKKNISLLLNPIVGYENQTQVISQSYVFSRFYAKGKDKKKEKGKKKIEVNESQLSEVINVISLKTQMQKSIDTLKEEFVKNLSLRSTTGSIESIQVNLDGKDYILQELAQIIRKNPTTLIINMATFPQAIPAALKSIEKSGMNLNPQQDGTTLYIPVPKVTKEHRENLSKNAKVLFTKCKDNIRSTQNKFTKNVKKQNTLGEDEIYEVQQQIVSIGDHYLAEAEKILLTKQHELVGKE